MPFRHDNAPAVKNCGLSLWIIASSQRAAAETHSPLTIDFEALVTYRQRKSCL